MRRYCDIPHGIAISSTVWITNLLDKESLFLLKESWLMRISILALTFITLTLGAAALGRAQTAAEGQKLYMTYCSSCHGDKGRGDGAAGKALPVKPADHTDGKLMNSLSDEFLITIISKGGAAVDKSSFMPAWGGVLKDNQLQDLLAYIRSIANPPKASGK
jgi:cytochrome c6